MEMFTAMVKPMTLEEGFAILDEGIAKAISILDGRPAKEIFGPADYMHYFDCVYTLCPQPPRSHHSPQLVQKYKNALQEGITSKILPSLMGKNGVPLLMEFSRLWTNYKAMAKCLSRFFLHLELKEPFCSEVSFYCFHDLVCPPFHERLIDAAIFLISQDRSGVPIDWNLLLSVKSLFADNGERAQVPCYDKFVEAILTEAETYYCHMASQWWTNCSSAADYLLKVEQCLKEEKGRATQLMSGISRQRLLEVVKFQLIGENADKLNEKLKAESHETVSYEDILSGLRNYRIE